MVNGHGREIRFLNGVLPANAAAYPEKNMSIDQVDARHTSGQVRYSSVNAALERGIRMNWTVNGTEPEDYTAIENILARSAENEYRIVETIAAVVDSPFFRQQQRVVWEITMKVLPVLNAKSFGCHGSDVDSTNRNNGFLPVHFPGTRLLFEGSPILDLKSSEFNSRSHCVNFWMVFRFRTSNACNLALHTVTCP